MNAQFTERVGEMRASYRGDCRLTGMDVWNAISGAHKKAVNSKNIRSGFAQTGLFPLSMHKVIRHGVRRSTQDVSLVRGSDLERKKSNLLLDFKRRGEYDPEIKCGYIDTTFGVELSRSDVLDLMISLESARAEIAKEKEADDL